MTVGLGAQDTTSADGQTPFRKGRYLVGATAYLLSQQLRYDDPVVGDSVSTNNYSIDAQAAMFLRDRLSVGLLFRISRSSTSEVLKREVETLNIGPSVRYYLSNSDEGSVFVNGAILYGRLHDEIAIEASGMPVVDRTTSGDGVVFNIGLGYSYVLYDRVTLEMQTSFNRSIYFSKINDRIDSTVTENNVYISDFIFGFGIYVLFD